MIHANPNQSEPGLNRRTILVRSIEYYTQQANRAEIELHELICGEDDDTTPLVRKGQGDYTTDIKPN